MSTTNVTRRGNPARSRFDPTPALPPQQPTLADRRRFIPSAAPSPPATWWSTLTTMGSWFTHITIFAFFSYGILDQGKGTYQPHFVHVGALVQTVALISLSWTGMKSMDVYNSWTYWRLWSRVLKAMKTASSCWQLFVSTATVAATVSKVTTTTGAVTTVVLPWIHRVQSLSWWTGLISAGPLWVSVARWLFDFFALTTFITKWFYVTSTWAANIAKEVDTHAALQSSGQRRKRLSWWKPIVAIYGRRQPELCAWSLFIYRESWFISIIVAMIVEGNAQKLLWWLFVADDSWTPTWWIVLSVLAQVAEIFVTGCYFAIHVLLGGRYPYVPPTLLAITLGFSAVVKLWGACFP